MINKIYHPCPCIIQFIKPDKSHILSLFLNSFKIQKRALTQDPLFVWIYLYLDLDTSADLFEKIASHTCLISRQNGSVIYRLLPTRLMLWVGALSYINEQQNYHKPMQTDLYMKASDFSGCTMLYKMHKYNITRVPQGFSSYHKNDFKSL